MIMRMKYAGLICGCLLGTGCVKDHTAAQLDQEKDQNAWIVNAYHTDIVRTAVVSQATIYSYHFVANGAQLNDLGTRDVGYLGEHFAQNPGRLNVNRDSADDKL